MRGSAFGRENNKGGYVQGYLTSRQFFSATVKSELPALEMLSKQTSHNISISFCRSDKKQQATVFK